MNVVLTLQRDFLKSHAHFEFGELTRLHVGTLGLLRRYKELQVSAIAERLYVSRPQMTVILDRLEELRLVRRGTRAGDRRVTTVALTEAGRITLEAAMIAAHRSLADKLSNLSDEELAEFGDALAVMERILARL